MRKANPRNKKIGKCKICGSGGRLTFEHVPPKSAFNDFHQLEYNLHESNKLLITGKGKYKPQQKGTGGYYLCQECNNKTGAWYGNAFKEWSKQIVQHVYGNKHVEKGVLNECKVNFSPLSVIKQIIIMFLCIHNYSWYSGGDIRRKLIDFVSNPETNTFPNELRVYFYGHSPLSTFARRIENATIAERIKYGEDLLASEIAMVGGGYIITQEKNINSFKFLEIPFLIDITFFKSYSYGQSESLKFEIPILPNNTAVLCDFREKENIKGTMPEGSFFLMNDKSVKGITVKK